MSCRIRIEIREVTRLGRVLANTDRGSLSRCHCIAQLGNIFQTAIEALENVSSSSGNDQNTQQKPSWVTQRAIPGGKTEIKRKLNAARQDVSARSHELAI